MEVVVTRFTKIFLVLSIIVFFIAIYSYAQQPADEMVKCPRQRGKDEKVPGQSHP